MQQTALGHIQTTEPAAEQQYTFPRRRPPDNRALWTAVQAIRADAPVCALPPEAVLALSAQIGNAALAALVTQQAARRIETAAYPPNGLPAVRSVPLFAAPSPPETAAPPAWDCLPELLAPPAQTIGGGTFG